MSTKSNVVCNVQIIISNTMGTSGILPITVNLTISGMNETSFLGLFLWDLDVIIANITNSPSSSVTSSFIEMVSTINSRNIYISDDKMNGRMVKRTNDFGALINVAITPTDTDHEQDITDAMNDTASFISDINSELKVLSYGNFTVISMSQIQRISGKLINGEV